MYARMTANVCMYICESVLIYFVLSFFCAPKFECKIKILTILPILFVDQYFNNLDNTFLSTPYIACHLEASLNKVKRIFNSVENDSERLFE